MKSYSSKKQKRNFDYLFVENTRLLLIVWYFEMCNQFYGRDSYNIIPKQPTGRLNTNNKTPVSRKMDLELTGFDR